MGCIFSEDGQIYQRESFKYEIPVPIAAFGVPRLDDKVSEVRRLNRQIFDFYDQDGDGYISHLEYHTIMRALSIFWKRKRMDVQIDSNFRDLDVDGDQYISHDEFQAPRMATILETHNLDVERISNVSESLRDESWEEEKWAESEAVLDAMITTMKLHRRVLTQSCADILGKSMKSIKMPASRNGKDPYDTLNSVDLLREYQRKHGKPKEQSRRSLRRSSYDHNSVNTEPLLHPEQKDPYSYD